MINVFINSKFDELGLTVEQKDMVGLHLLANFSAAIGHRPYVQHGDITYGNLCMVLVGKTGSGKGSSCRFANGIFSGFGEDVAAPMLQSSRVTSMKGFLREIDNMLSDEVRSARGEIRLYHINEEFGTELRAAASSYHSGVTGFLCKLIEGNRISETLGRQHIEYPLVHYAFMGHIQPDELKRTIRPSFITSGCASRLLWFEMPEEMTTPLPAITQEIKNEIADDIEESIRFAASQRAITLTAEALTEYDAFLDSLREEAAQASELMQNMLPRFPQNALKIALVLTMLQRSNQIEVEIMRDAIRLINQSKNVIHNCLGAPAQQVIENEILQKIRAAGKIQPHALLHSLLPICPVAKARKKLHELEANGLIRLKAIDRGDGTFPKCYMVCE